MLWSKKKRDSDSCEKMRLLCLAIEVLTDTHVSLNDANIIEKGKGDVLIGDEKKTVEVKINSDNQLQFTLYSKGEEKNWHIADFEVCTSVKITNRYDPNQPKKNVCVVGYSNNNRR